MTSTPQPQRRVGLRVHGVVQGVGFRPFVYRVARSLGLGGHVLNDERGVWVELQGDEAALAAFVHALLHEAPPLARVEGVDEAPLPLAAPSPFVIAPSVAAGGSTLVPPDAATCPACLADLSAPTDRRYRYAFTNCTDCGPRYTIIQGLPYDRPRTTMHAFAQCPDCAAEYADPADRRFHAQPNACPRCGPQLELLRPDGSPWGASDPLTEAEALLAQGAVLAIKGLGGYHLACDASDEAAVRRLRQAKGRDAKPFAVMALDLATVETFAEVAPAERAALESPARPIVLLRQRKPGPLAPSLAPGLDTVGVMLPYTPLHHLLLREGPRRCLVMTSGNRSSEPIVTDEGGALAVLGPMVDALLVHDRVIHARADDSVLRLSDGAPHLMRRSRGYAPEPLDLPSGEGQVLAVGGQLKAAVCLARGRRAFLGPHVGDLDHPAARAFLAESVEHLRALLRIEPELVVHDLHPDAPSAEYARTLGLPCLELQHHHAHGLACLADNGVAGPALALCLDGTGYGLDGTLWGGELLELRGLDMRRLGHLRPLPLPGGERAIAEPWRTATAAAWAGGQRPPLFSGVAPAKIDAVFGLLGGPALDLFPRSSALGRVFDAAAALLDLQPLAHYEGQGPIRLEDAAWRWRRARGAPGPTLPWDLARPAAQGPWQLDLLPALLQLPARRGQPEQAAAEFHDTVCAALVALARRGAEESGLHRVALSGGVLQNRLVHEGLRAGLEAAGLEPLVHRRSPANDGGLALGQAWAGQLWLATPRAAAACSPASRR